MGNSSSYPRSRKQVIIFVTLGRQSFFFLGACDEGREIVPKKNCTARVRRVWPNFANFARPNMRTSDRWLLVFAVVLSSNLAGGQQDPNGFSYNNQAQRFRDAVLSEQNFRPNVGQQDQNFLQRQQQPVFEDDYYNTRQNLPRNGKFTANQNGKVCPKIFDLFASAARRGPKKKHHLCDVICLCGQKINIFFQSNKLFVSCIQFWTVPD